MSDRQPTAAPSSAADLAGPNTRLAFGEFVADLATGELRRNGALVRVQDLPFRLLAVLLGQPGVLVGRAELARALWGSETFVDFEAGLNTAVAKLRDALDDRAESPVFVETVPKRGYRFIGRVAIADDALPRPLLPPAVSAPSPVASPSAGPRRLWELAAIMAATIVAVGLIDVGFRAEERPVRVAVALFDNETGRPELDQRSQTLTDATVVALARNRSLAVVGNAAILRTSRPFRDLVAIRDALHADFIVIGQLQLIDGRTVAVTHLIRAADQVHVWVERTPMAASTEGAFEDVLTERVTTAVARAATK